MRHLVYGLGLAVALTGPALAAGDPGNGAKIFTRCKACHVIDSDQNRVGPHLSGVIGRKAGTADGFNYSAGMKAAGEKGIVWNDDTINQYLENPKGYVPGNKMAFPGLKKPEERADVIAYIDQMNHK